MALIFAAGVVTITVAHVFMSSDTANPVTSLFDHVSKELVTCSSPSVHATAEFR
jgi:hypothetical protein